MAEGITLYRYMASINSHTVGTVVVVVQQLLLRRARPKIPILSGSKLAFLIRGVSWKGAGGDFIGA